MYDILVIGAGLAGLVCARELAEKGYRVHISERRNHIGGNLYDYIDSEGFLIQKYGPHTFYTNDAKIREYIERFVETEDFYARYRTVIDGKYIPMPFNYKSLEMIYADRAGIIKQKLEETFPGKEVVFVTDLLNAEDEQIASYGRYMFEKEYKKYTAKQWGMSINEIDEAVFNRVPVYLSYRDIYQSACYQFLPKEGFTHLAEKLIAHNGISISLNEDFLGKEVVIQNDRIGLTNKTAGLNIPIIYTGEIDALLNYRYGQLPYRSLEFIIKHYNVEEYQETEIVAYPETDKITRITEYKKLPKQNIRGKTVISVEIPIKYDRSQPVGNEPYYPVKNKDSEQLYKKYHDDASKIKNLFFCGRLAEFRYYDMDAVIKRAWEVAAEVEAALK